MIGKARLDPWGNPYQYLRLLDPESGGTGGGGKGGKGGKGGGGGGGKEKAWKDHFLVPLNTDYDLYSMGPDGRSVAPLTAAASRDDIVRADDGEFVDEAVKY